MKQGRLGLLYGVGAYFSWGFFPLYFPLLRPAGALEILAMRMLWSLVTVAVLLALTGGWGEVLMLARDRSKLRRLCAAAAVISLNWGFYIWGVNSGHVLETSLGYFINPLVTILFGIVLLHERLRRVQWLAVSIAACAIVVITYDYGRPPWIALTLAVSFATYGLLKKQVSGGALATLAVETSVLALPAVLALTVLGLAGELTLTSHGWSHTALLASAGLVTAGPLLLFAASTSRLPLSMIGLLQYLAPVLQFAVGVGVRHEPISTARLTGFAMVWVALLILIADGLRHAQRNRSQLRSPAGAPGAYA